MQHAAWEATMQQGMAVELPRQFLEGWRRRAASADNGRWHVKARTRICHNGALVVTPGTARLPAKLGPYWTEPPPASGQSGPLQTEPAVDQPAVDQPVRSSGQRPCL